MRQLLPVAALLLAGTAFPAFPAGVGVTAAVNQQARGTPPNGGVRTLSIGDNVVFNERIDTNPVGLLQILLADGTAFTVGPNASLVIDRFVYNPAAGTAEVSATLTKGVFRFIGGKTSKTPNGVRLNSPVGTIGIRGAVVDVALEGRGDASVAMVFGREVTLTAPGGQVNRVYEPGYSIVVETGADGRERRRVMKTPPSAANQIQSALAGRPGTAGGAPSSPTDAIVAQSRVDRDNSAVAPAVNNPPIPQSRTEAVAQLEAQGPAPGEVADAIRAAGFDVAQGDVEEAVGAQPGGDPDPGPNPGPTPNPDPDPTPDPDPQPNPDPNPNPNPQPNPDPEPNPNPGPGATALPVRLLTAGETYTNLDGQVIPSPGAAGLVGGSPEEDRTATLEVPAGGSSGTATTNRGALVLPVLADGDLREQIIASEDGASLGGVPLAGSAYAGVDGFRVYALGLDGDETRPVYALAGTPIADTSVLSSGDVRTYSFTPDFLQDLPVPFMADSVLAVDYSTASVTPFYLAESGGTGSSKLFQSWLIIQGAGPTQKSGIGVTAAALQQDASGAFGFQYGRRGTYRDDAYGLSYRMTGGVASLSGPGGGNELFGSNGQYLVLGAGIADNDDFQDGLAGTGTTGNFGSYHLLGLQGERPAEQFAAERGTTRNLGAAGDQVVRGFAAGLQETYTPFASYNDVSASGRDPNAVYIQFNRQTRSVGGEIEIATPSIATHVAFGAGVLGNTGGGQSAYVDDDTFGAIQNNNRNRTTVTVPNDSGTPATYRQVSDRNANTYFVSGDANPQPNLLPNGQLCACKFLEWGWWGTGIRASTDPNNDNDDNRIRSQVHLGQWVAGDIATNAQVSTLSGTATYAGNALGHVSLADGTGLADYLASGSMRMSYDFGARSGSMNIDNFDGRDFAGTIGADLGDTPDALFNGSLGQTNGNGTQTDASGAVNGAFVNNGAAIAAGAVGNFQVGSGDGAWNASGIFAGARP